MNGDKRDADMGANEGDNGHEADEKPGTAGN